MSAKPLLLIEAKIEITKEQIEGLVREAASPFVPAGFIVDTVEPKYIGDYDSMEFAGYSVNLRLVVKDK